MEIFLTSQDEPITHCQACDTNRIPWNERNAVFKIMINPGVLSCSTNLVRNNADENYGIFLFLENINNFFF